MRVSRAPIRARDTHRPRMTSGIEETMSRVKLRLRGQEDDVERLLETLRSDEAVRLDEKALEPRPGGYVVVHAVASTDEDE